jgi:hypothetical protein
MTITWTINNLERQTSDGLVTVVHWGASATEASNDPEKPYSASIVNTQALERGDSFVNYDTLTQETVLGWLWGKLDKEAVEAALAAQIEQQKTPTTASGLPWGQE